MGTTEQKLDKIKQTKRRLKTVINGLGGGLTESSKFSDYPLALSQLYSRLPKTTYQTGTNINLGKTLKAVVQYEDDKVLYGDTEQEGTPTPTEPIPISVVTGTQEVVVRGKNLTNLGVYNGTINGISVTTEKDVISYNGTTTGNNNITPNGYNYVDLGEFKAGTYSLKLFGLSGTYNTNTKTSAIYLRNGEKQTIINLKMEVLLSEAREFTLETNQHLYFQQYSASGIEYNNFVMGIQIETGTATTYEPYITPTTYQVHLGNLELAKIGDYVDDIEFNLDEGKWYKKKAINKLVLNGTEDWAFNANNTVFVKRDIPLGIMLLDWQKPLILSNYYSSQPFGEIYEAHEDYGIAFGATNADRVCIRNKDITSVADFKNWLSSHNVIEYYPLATLTDDEITDTTLIQDLDNILAMMSVEGNTIIEVSGNLPAPIKVRAVKGE